MCRKPAAALSLLIAWLLAGACQQQAAQAPPTPLPQVAVTINSDQVEGHLASELSTQLDSSVRPAKSRQAFARLAPPSPRIHAGFDGEELLPGGRDRAHWNFAPLDGLVDLAYQSGSPPILNVRYAPQWMWTCAIFQSPGQLNATAFDDFGAYLASLVAYFNLGATTTPEGLKQNPFGARHRIDSWEIWNEPDQSGETPCRDANGGPALTVPQYRRLWDSAARQMLAVDPSLRLVGPATSGANERAVAYIQALLAAPVRPAAVSVHAYAVGVNTATDLTIWRGDSSEPGLDGLVAGIAAVQAAAGAIPVWVTELNVDSYYLKPDPRGRPGGALGVSFGAEAFIQLARLGIPLVHQFAFDKPLQFGMVDRQGRPYPAYWRDATLRASLVPGSERLVATSGTPDVDVLAVRRSAGRVDVVIVNRAIDTAHDGSGRALAINLEGLPQHMRLTRLGTGRDQPRSSAWNGGQLRLAGYEVAVLTST